MEISNAVNFLVGSLLFSVGAIIIALMILFLNNMFSKYWKSIKWQIYSPAEYTVVDHSVLEELKQSLDKQKSEHKLKEVK